MDPARMQPHTDTTAATLSPTTCGEHLATVHIVPRRSPVLSVSDGSGLPACRLGLDQKNGIDRFQNRPDKRSAASKRSKPGRGPVEPRVSPGLARPVRSDLRVWVSGFSIYGRIQYPTVNCILFTMVLHYHFVMYWQPLYSKQLERRSLPHPENERQSSIINWWSCIVGNLSGAWSHVSINK